MKLKQKVSILTISFWLLAGVFVLLTAQPVGAVDFDSTFDINTPCEEQFPGGSPGSEAQMAQDNCKAWQSSVKEACAGINQDTDQATKDGCKSLDIQSGTNGCVGEDCCGGSSGVKTSIITDDNICNAEGEGGVIFGILKWVLRIMTAGVGIAAVGGIAWGALLYTTAESKPEQTKKAIGIITNVVIGLVAYALMGVFLNFLIPGGVLQ